MTPEIDYEEIAQCRFPADLRCIRAALDKLGAYCRGHGLRPALWNQVELAVAERGSTTPLNTGAPASPTPR